MIVYRLKKFTKSKTVSTEDLDASVIITCKYNYTIYFNVIIYIYCNYNSNNLRLI